MLNAIIVTDGGKDPVPQKDDTEPFWNGAYIRGLEAPVWSSTIVCGYRNEVAAVVC